MSHSKPDPTREDLDVDAKAFNEVYDIVCDFLYRDWSELAASANDCMDAREALLAIYAVCIRADYQHNKIRTAEILKRIVTAHQDLLKDLAEGPDGSLRELTEQEFEALLVEARKRRRDPPPRED